MDVDTTKLRSKKKSGDTRRVRQPNKAKKKKRLTGEPPTNRLR